MNDWDGGWEDAVESGEGLDDIVLGPVHAYGRATSDQPAHRWGSRHEIVSQRFADPSEAAPADTRADDHDPAEVARRRSPARRSARSVADQQVRRRGAAARLHVRLGIQPAEAADFEDLLRHARRGLPAKLGKKQKRAKLAAAVGMTVTELQLYNSVIRNRNRRAPDLGPRIRQSLSRRRTVGGRQARPTSRGSVHEINGLPVRFVRPSPPSRSSQPRARGGRGGGGPLMPVPRPKPKRATPPKSVTATTPKASATKATAKGKRKRQSTDREVGTARQSRHLVPGCAACGLPISVNGRCGCS